MNRISQSILLTCEQGFKNNCLKACAEVSKWTNLCENSSINLFKQFKLAEAQDQSSEFYSACKDFLQQVEEILSKPLKLANRNRKLAKERDQKLASLSQEATRFLEDHFITISDLIIFYSISTLIELSKDGWLRSILQSEFKSTCTWYNRVLEDVSTVNGAYKQKPSLSVTSDHQGLPSVDKLQLDQLSLKTRDDEDEPVNADLFVYELKYKMLAKNSVKVPFECDGQFN